jgi:hypothetical protein
MVPFSRWIMAATGLAARVFPVVEPVNLRASPFRSRLDLQKTK